ncbi:MAG: methyltransferase domain-containing protein [Flavobacteriia bacterium]|nr:methyltransferase domain-containing protein [Flavobacteriia bacterium]
MNTINILKRKYLQSIELRSLEKFNFTNEEENIINQHVDLFKKIEQKHKIYIKTISSPEMAMSFELAKFIFSYCLIKKPKKVADLGSGFSSFLFRFYKKEVNNELEIYSIDDSADWLIKTKDYLIENGLNIDNLITLTDFIDLKLKNEFDVVLLDLNFVEVRKNYIGFSFDLLKENGFLIIDDVHKVEFLRDVKAFFSSNSRKLINLKKQTYDNFLRFSTGIIK